MLPEVKPPEPWLPDEPKRSEVESNPLEAPPYDESCWPYDWLPELYESPVVLSL